MQICALGFKKFQKMHEPDITTCLFNLVHLTPKSPSPEADVED